MRRSSWSVLAGLISAVLFAGVAGAQPSGGNKPWAEGVSEADRITAGRLFEEGNALLKDAIFVKAAEKYREAITHWDHPAIQYNLALALVPLDQPIEMYRALERAMAYEGAALEKDYFERAKSLKILTEKQLANVEFTCDVPGAVVAFNGKEVFTGPGTWKQLIPSGAHALLVRAEGRITSNVDVKVVGGETFKAECQLFTEKDLLRTKQLMPTWVPYTIGGAGLAIVGGGVLLHLSAKNSFAEYDSGVRDCAATDPTGGCTVQPPQLFDLKSSANNKQAIAIGAYAVGGAAIAAGVTLLVLNRPQTYRLDAKELEDDGVSLTPVLSPGLAGFAATGRF